MNATVATYCIQY